MTPDVPNPGDPPGDEALRDRLSHLDAGDELTVHLTDGRDLAGEVRDVEETPPHEDRPPQRELLLELDGEGYQLTIDPRSSYEGEVDLYRRDEANYGEPAAVIDAVTVPGDEEP
jgi:hypothetical protein